MLPALRERSRLAAYAVVAQRAAEVNARHNVAERLHCHSGVQITVCDVFVVAVMVRIGCGDKGYAVGRLHGADLFCDRERLGPDVLGNIRLHILIARFH